MQSSELGVFIESPCRFILKSGKEIFGRVFKRSSDELFFASNGEFQKWKLSNSEKQIGVRIKVDDIVYVERITV